VTGGGLKRIAVGRKRETSVRQGISKKGKRGGFEKESNGTQTQENPHTYGYFGKWGDQGQVRDTWAVGGRGGNFEETISCVGAWGGFKNR